MSAFEDFCRNGLKEVPCLSDCEICKAMWNAALDHAANIAGRHAFLNQENERSCAVCEAIVKDIEKEKV